MFDNSSDFDMYPLYYLLFLLKDFVSQILVDLRAHRKKQKKLRKASGAYKQNKENKENIENKDNNDKKYNNDNFDFICKWNTLHFANPFFFSIEKYPPLIDFLSLLGFYYKENNEQNYINYVKNSRVRPELRRLNSIETIEEFHNVRFKYGNEMHTDPVLVHRKESLDYDLIKAALSSIKEFQKYMIEFTIATTICDRVVMTPGRTENGVVSTSYEVNVNVNVFVVAIIVSSLRYFDGFNTFFHVTVCV